MLFEKYSEDDYEAVCDDHSDEIKELQKQGFLRYAWICEEVSLHIL